MSSAHYLTTLSQPVAVVPPIPRGSPRGPRRAHGVALAPAAPCTTRRSGNRLARSAAPSGWSRQPDPLALGRRPPIALPGRGKAGRRRSHPHSRPAARIPTAAATRLTDGVGSCRCVPPQSLAAACGQCEHGIKFAIRQQSAIGGDRRAVGPEHWASNHWLRRALSSSDSEVWIRSKSSLSAPLSASPAGSAIAAPFDLTQHIVSYTIIWTISPQNAVPSGECGING